VKALVRCPKCESDNTVISAEVIHVDHIQFEWKQKGKGVKLVNYKLNKRALPYADIRVFFRCETCSFVTDNLDGYDDIEGYEEEVAVILDQVQRSINGSH
jgi:hypothetical protein